MSIAERLFHVDRRRNAEEAKRLKELEGGNRRLKKLLAEAEQNKSNLKETLKGNGARRVARGGGGSAVVIPQVSERLQYNECVAG